jgi:hypothetical protein
MKDKNYSDVAIDPIRALPLAVVLALVSITMHSCAAQVVWSRLLTPVLGPAWSLRQLVAARVLLQLLHPRLGDDDDSGLGRKEAIRMAIFAIEIPLLACAVAWVLS